MSINASLVAELKKKTSAGLGDCKEALLASNGDLEQAVVYLRKKGLADIKERENRTASEGSVGHYIHLGGKIAVLCEVNCETDFCSKSPDFQTFTKEVSMHIAATNPLWISRSEVPEEIIKRETDIALNNIDPNKPQQVLEKIVTGRLNKFYKETCLLEQPFVRDQNITVQDLLGGLAAKVGEKIVIKRFVRFAVGS